MKMWQRLAAATASAVLAAGGMVVATTSPAQAGTAPGDVSIAAPCGYNGGHPTLSTGSTGPAVSHAQCLLRMWGWTNVAQDGDFGPITRDAVMAAQDACGIAVDGVVGPNTWRCLHPDEAPNPR